MNSKEFKTKHPIFAILYIIANIFTLGTIWWITNLIAYAISKSND